MNQRGFSFLELILVIFLISIMSLSANVSIRLVQKVQFESVVNEVVQGIRQIQQCAVMTGNQYNIYCMQNKIYLRQGNAPAFYKIVIQDGVVVSIRDDQGRQMTGKNIKFYGKMAPSKAGTIVLKHIGLKEEARITVRVATGKVTVYYKKENRRGDTWEIQYV